MNSSGGPYNNPVGAIANTEFYPPAGPLTMATGTRPPWGTCCSGDSSCLLKDGGKGSTNVYYPPVKDTLTPQSVVSPREYARVQDMLRGIVEPTVLSALLFSDANLKILQNMIRRAVYDQSHGKFLVAPQDETQLNVVIRAMYLQYSYNQQGNYPKQIEELNRKVADYCIKEILAQVQQYRGYIIDSSTLPVPMDLPKNMSWPKHHQLQPQPWI